MTRKIKSVEYHGTVYTVDAIKEKLKTNNAWLIRGILAIYAYQTAEEKMSGHTKDDNGMGFNGVDAEFLTHCALFYNKNKFLTPKQIAIAGNKMVKYAGQLLHIIKNKNN